MKISITQVILVLMLLWVNPLYAENDNQVDVKNNPYFSALFQIGLVKEQLEPFKELINEYANKRAYAINWEMGRKRNRLDYRIKKSHRKIRKSFSGEMAEFLNEDQYSRFPSFQKQLDKLLAKRERDVMKRSSNMNVKSTESYGQSH